MENSFEHNYFKKNFLSSIFIVASIATLVDIPISLFQGETVKAAIQVIPAVVLAFSGIYLQKKNLDILFLSMVTFTFCFFAGIFFSFFGDPKSLYWLLIFPPAVLFVFSLKRGVIWMIFSYMVLIPILIFHIAQNTIPLREGLNFIMSYSFSVVSAYFIEKSRSSLENRLKSATERAENLGNAKMMFLSNMSHELRTPLNAIIGFSTLIDTKKLSDENCMFVDKISNSSNHLLSLVNDILDLAKIENGNLEIHNEVFPLKKLTDSVEEIAHILIKDQGKKIKYILHQSEDVSSHIVADIKRLKQILFNFVSNAVKFTKKGEVTLSISLPDAGSIKFSVSDTGIGIDHDHQQNVFSSFVQIKSSLAQKYAGTGLGLTISKKLTELMDGTIGVESRTEHITGSRFYFTIPYVTAQSNLTGETQAETIRLERLHTILLTEDNEVNQLLAQKMLTKMGYEVVVAENGKQAIEILESGTPIDLILMDIQMPIMNGIEATEVIRKKEKEKQLSAVPIIALSAGVFDIDIQIARNAGCNDYVTKPIDIKILTNVLKKYAHTSS